ncbi:MAG: cupredoxin domain-containing protein [Cellvibrionaceae bacterium]|nr:cupredoxin domain-containing protein [Cellvibrionaceae bacterium]
MKEPLFMKWILWLCIFLAFPALAAPSEFNIRIEDHLFIPDVLRVPANQKIRLRVINRDNSSEEFESYQLNREKIIPGKSEAIIFIGPLAPGEYPFFGEFNPATAQGRIIVE